MAEPLLKRTFSRLRGKERFRRKTDPKLADVPGKTELDQGASSSSVSVAVEAEPAPHEDFTRRTQITVAKKQNWAKLASTSREPTGFEVSHSLGSRAQDWENCSGKAQASKQAWSQKTLSEDGLEGRCHDLEWELGRSRIPCDSLDGGPPELAPPAGGYADACMSSSTVKLSGQGAYLQSLERSSRAWVLSTGKPQASEKASSSRLLPNSLTEWRQGGAEGENNIWYNPIPEEEDARGNGCSRDEYGDPWRKRETEGSPESSSRMQKWAGLLGNAGGAGGGGSRLERHTAQCPSGGSSPGSIHHAKEVIAELETSSKEESPDVSAQAVRSEPQCVGGGVGGSTSSSSSTSGVSGAPGGAGSPSDSPGALKKGGGSVSGGNSMMDKIKSPGTVRRLSMKMRKLPELRRKLSLRSSRNQRNHTHHGNPDGAAGVAEDDGASPPNARKEASNNVISRYHLDSTAPPARPRRRSSRARSASKGGYLSDGDSPELLPKQGAPSTSHGSPPPPPHHGDSSSPPAIADAGSYRLYSLADQPRCAQRVSGLLTVHLLGVEELLRSPRGGDSAAKEVFCAIQVDGVTRARTSLLSCRGAGLPLNHTFNLELERARLLKLVVLTPSSSGGTGGTTRNRVCCLGALAIPPLFKASRSQQLCVKLEPRGLLYVKLTLLEQWEAPSPRLSELPPPSVFGVELRHLVDKESSPLKVPLLIQKSVAEIEKRGLKVVGLYRLCGSAAVKKELRDAFERDSAAVVLNEELYPDVNVITGILKDYLRELPSPLITRTLYEVVLEAMALRPACRSDADAQRCQSTVSLLHCLPEPEKATLSLLLDHLSLVASFSDSNRMTCQNLAVCFGPVLLTPTQESWRPGVPGAGVGGRGGKSFAHSEEINSAVDFKRHIEALHYLLQLWPIPTDRDESDLLPSEPSPSPPASPCALQRLPLRLDLPLDAVVSRRGRGRLESPPCNRYAGDWSVCGRDFLSGGDADYDEVAGSDSDQEEEEKKDGWASPAALYVDDFALDFDAPFTCRLSLKDFDTLISDLERELAKQINICL